ncbi:MAG: endonuclease/exonuclease/phosphatase family protein [Gammaproteobacteria bacterium]|nr:endonuclease/exonuclease/phosphatase family protein [Gammaproteobacteria bacterium]
MRVTLTGLLQAAAVVTIAFSVGTLLPIDHFAIQLFTHFRLQYVVVSLSLLLLFKYLRSPWLIGALAASLVLNASLVLPWYVGEDETSGGVELKLLHANVLSSNTEYDRLISLLDTEAPDLVMLQEVSPDWLVALDELRADYPYSYAEAREGNFGIALFSRVPLKSVSHFDSPPFGYPTIVASLDIDGQVLHFIGTHPMIPVRGTFYDARNEQLAGVARLLGKQAEPKILVGDLNLSQWDVNYKHLEQQGGVRNARKGFGILPTWPVFMPFAMIPIDHVLVSETISVTGFYSGPRIGSDHLPLIVTFSL